MKVKYELTPDGITEYGHIMFLEDVIMELNKIISLQKKNKELMESNTNYLSYLMDRDDALDDFEQWKQEEKDEN